MEGKRFARVWALWAALYLPLATLGPNGLVPVPVWPHVSQHLLQARARIGSDIRTTADETESGRLIAVRPRLDVTPYFQQRVVGDPREDALMARAQ